MNPPSGMEPTAADGLSAITCPKCGHEIPPIARPARKHAAQVAAPTARLNRAPELEDATPTVAHPIDPRLAATDRAEPRD